MLRSISLKVASRCNINCSYCYVYNKGDSTWLNKPSLMNDAVFEATLERVVAYCEETHTKQFCFAFHGGEPTLLPAERADRWCALATQRLQGVATPQFAIQTNAVKLRDSWIDVLQKWRFRVGVSLDGPKSINDRNRVDHRGNGTFDQVEGNIKRLIARGIPFGILSVIPLGADPLAVHNAYISLGCTGIGYILPHFTHETIHEALSKHGPTPCADFLLPIMDHWFYSGNERVMIREFDSLARLIMGGRSVVDAFGNDPFGYLFVESDGSFEGLDILRIVAASAYRTERNVFEAELQQLLNSEDLVAKSLRGDIPLPDDCAKCPEAKTCSGGYLPHRYSSDSSFNNPSVWCRDILKLFGHMRDLLDVSSSATEKLRNSISGVPK